jgi:hypothetical protein
MKKLASLARQSGLPGFVDAELQKDRAVLVPFYLRAYWYCVVRMPHAAAGDESTAGAGTTRVYRLEIPLENDTPQTEPTRTLISRVGQIDVRHTPSGPVEEPALPLEGEEARRVAFMWDFYQHISGRAGTELKLSFTPLSSDSPVP